MTPESTPQTDQVVVAMVLGVHGKSGQLRARVQSDVPERFDPGQLLYIHNVPYAILTADRLPRNQILLTLEGIDSSEVVRELVGASITAPQPAETNLPSGEYFHYQLMGLHVVTEEGEELGVLSEILETGSNDVYIVTGSGGDLLIPALAQVVREVDLHRGTMVVHLLPGLR